MGTVKNAMNLDVWPVQKFTQYFTKFSFEGHSPTPRNVKKWWSDKNWVSMWVCHH